MESKRTFRYKYACTGIGCPARFTCGAFFAMNYKDRTEEVIRPPFIKDATGKFKSCDKFRVI